MHEFTREHAQRLIAKMRAFHGKKFSDQWAGVEVNEIVDAMVECLHGLSGVQLARGYERLKTSTFCPSVSEFRAWCEPNSEWPTAEQAWAIAQAASNEADTVVWTAEAQAAWTSCQSLIEINDWFNASRCFKDTYSREVQTSQLQGKRPVYQASLGHNQELRVIAIRDAESKGLLGSNEATKLIGYIEEEKAAPTDFALEMLAKMKRQLEGENHEATA